MNLKHYDYLAGNSFQAYVFFSEGPKGRIKKIVRYTKINEDPVIYNLGFGDEDKTTRDVNDTIISNNNDRDVVLVRVANTIIDFTDHYGNHSIIAQGNTPAKTRLYI